MAEARTTFDRLLAGGETLLAPEAAGELRRMRAAAEAALARPDLTLAVLGSGRAALLERIFGARLVDAGRREHAAARVSFRHGASPGYLARLRGGTSEEFAELCPDESAAIEREGREARQALDGGRAGLQAAADALAEELRAVDEIALRLTSAHGVAGAEAGQAAAAEETLARVAAEAEAAVAQVTALRAAIPAYARHRPRWWAVWAWVPRALFAGKHRAALEELAAAARGLAILDERREHAAAALAAARETWSAHAGRVEHLTHALAAAEQRLGGFEKEQGRLAVEIAGLEGEVARLAERLRAHQAERFERFAAAVRALTDGRARGGEVEELIVEVPDLPPALVVLDVAATGHVLDVKRQWEQLARHADGCAVTAGELPRELRLLFARPLIVPADPAELVPRLVRSRCLRVGRIAGEALRTVRDALDAVRSRAGEKLQQRVQAIEIERRALVDRLESGLAGARGAVKERVCLAIMQARDVVERELARLGQSWIGAVSRARSADEVRSALAAMGAEQLAAVRDEAQRTFRSTLSGAVRDLWPQVFGEPAPDAATVAAVAGFDPMPRWDVAAVPAPSVSWLTARLRPLDAVQAECVAALDSRVATLTQQAVADLLECEPRAAEALHGALRRLVDDRIAASGPWFDAAVGEARRQVELETARAEGDFRGTIDRLTARLARAEEALLASW